MVALTGIEGVGDRLIGWHPLLSDRNYVRFLRGLLSSFSAYLRRGTWLGHEGERTGRAIERLARSFFPPAVAQSGRDYATRWTASPNSRQPASTLPLATDGMTVFAVYISNAAKELRYNFTRIPSQSPGGTPAHLRKC
jgi:hypothetical protein